MPLAHVNIGDVSKFKESISDAKDVFFNTQDKFYNTLDIATRKVNEGIREAKELIERCQKSIQALEHKIESLQEVLAGLQASLAATPPTITETTQDEEGNIICSQLAWGTGRDEDAETYSRRDWYLEFDAGLDDEGQLELARWLMEHGGFAGFILASPEQVHIAASVKDGTYARVTGLERPGNTILVQELELIHPDGTAETILETGAEGEDPITVELNYLELNSALAAGGRKCWTWSTGWPTSGRRRRAPEQACETEAAASPGRL